METTWVRGRAGAGAVRLASVLLSLLGIVLAVGVHANLPGGAREPKAGQSSTVILITGDRVHLQWRPIGAGSAGGVQATVVPASGREAISFARMSSGVNARNDASLPIGRWPYGWSP